MTDIDFVFSHNFRPDAARERGVAVRVGAQRHSVRRTAWAWTRHVAVTRGKTVLCCCSGKVRKALCVRYVSAASFECKDILPLTLSLSVSVILALSKLHNQKKKNV